MLLLNSLDEHNRPLEAKDATLLGPDAAAEVERFLSLREGHRETPLLSLPGLAAELGVGAIHIKDEGQRLGLGSFKALGGAYAVIRLVLEAAAERYSRSFDATALGLPQLSAVAADMTVCCATDGNHGRSVAQGAQRAGCRCVIFIHAGVSSERAAAIARLGAEIVRVQGHYDDSVAAASRVAAENGWITVSDTSWPGYERIPGYVMQGYTALLAEALRALAEPPTHVFVQAGVGGIAAAVAGHLAVRLGDRRPYFVVVEPARAACVYESARLGRLTKVPAQEPTVIAMLECYEPSLVAWRVLTRAADAFLTVEEDAATEAMNRLAFPTGNDPAIVAGESGGVGLAGLMQIASSDALRARVGLTRDARVFLINTEGATDPALYEAIVGAAPERIAGNPESEVRG